MFWAGLAVSTVIAVAYLALSATIVQRVLLVGAQWRSNPLAAATAGIFFSCGVGHSLHAVHLLEHPDIAALHDPHVVLWDLTTAAVAVWYWTIRSQLSALTGTGELFQDAGSQERARLAGVLHGLFDGVLVLPSGQVPVGALPAVLRGTEPEVRCALLDAVHDVGADGVPRSLEVAVAGGALLEVRASRWAEQVVLAWRDVTALRDAERKHAEVAAQLAAAFDAAPGAMAVVAGGVVQRGNRALARLAGAQVEGTPLTALFAVEHRPDVVVRLADVDEAGRHARFEAQVLPASGGQRWAEVTLAPVDDLQPGRDGDLGQPGQVVVHLVDVEDRRAWEARMQHQADHDALTGLVNRRRFDEELTAQCARSDRTAGHGALLLVDLDHFKEVNDTLGHAVGDDLLVGVARLLRHEVQPGDVVARLGGDEFAVLCREATREQALALADRLCEVVRVHTRSLAGPTVATGRVTCSVGVAVLDDAATPEGLLVAADLTLYDAKDAGRDRAAVYSDDEQEQPRSKSRMQWLDRLRVALDRDELVVLAQPIVDLATRKTDHVELLVRLPGADGTLVPPVQFLHLAEQSDLVCEVDLRMLAAGIRYARSHPGLGVCVNVSGRTVSDPAVVDRLEALLRAAALPVGQIVLEVTETAAVAGTGAAREGLLRLQATGARVALDDFGAGFSSLTYVKHLPFDILKIDGQFVAGCAGDVTDLVVVDAVVSLARGLGKTVVAEHVQDERTAALLLRHGVQRGQGYHLGPPRPVLRLPEPRDADAPLALSRAV